MTSWVQTSAVLSAARLDPQRERRDGARRQPAPVCGW